MTSNNHVYLAPPSAIVPTDALSTPAVFLDLDGTLLELAPRPDEVVVPARLPALLDELVGLLHGALAIVSGRPIASIDALLAPFRSAAAGLHGTQMRLTSSSPIVSTVLATPPRAVLERLTILQRLSTPVLLEDKGPCLAIHHRLQDDVLNEVREAIQAAIVEHAPDLDLLEGRRVLEIKPRAIDKGVACRTLLDASPFNGRQAFYFGDDITDIAAFRFMDTVGGASIAVGPRVKRHASSHMSGPSDVLAWLQALRDRLRLSHAVP